MVARALFAPDCPASTATGGAGGGCSGTLDGANSCLRTKLRSADRVRNHRVCSGQARSRRHRRPRRRNQCALGARPALGHVRLFGCFVLGHRRANLDCAKAAPGILRAWVRPSIHSLCCADDCDSLRTCSMLLLLGNVNSTLGGGPAPSDSALAGAISSFQAFAVGTIAFPVAAGFSNRVRDLGQRGLLRAVRLLEVGELPVLVGLVLVFLALRAL